MQAMKTLFYVPRFRGQTILQPLKAKYGRVLLYAWPKSSHGGLKANNLMAGICKLAGITNIGIKVTLLNALHPIAPNLKVCHSDGRDCCIHGSKVALAV